ncbi:hypothetical protein [Streptomyces nigrescens]|uniref:Uncharacterized protein n=1 Tax=Streptomyces nigrescens TaxID=1920 RepID=A0ABY7IZH3_STRNI|nr:hypothetical protein [Streptomyces nigrescens]WAU04090.1 hypothetical protein STRNI_002322 [Streptomyces nigrescens]
MTTDIDLNEQIYHLRHLGDDFMALHDRVRGLAAAPGTETLRQLAPLVFKSQELVGKVLLSLSALGGSPYAAVIGSRQSLRGLGGLVADASQASWGLAQALAVNPLDGIGFGGPSHDEDNIRNARHARDTPEMAGHLGDAAWDLNVCAASCHQLATGISHDLERALPTTRQALQGISPTQYEALTSLAKGGATIQTRDRGSTIVLTPDHTLITIATFQSLDKRGLVHLDTSIPLHQGRGITVTAEGHRALAQHRARTGATTVPAAASTAAAATMPTVAVKREVRR